jgi:hypothetical protein
MSLLTVEILKFGIQMQPKYQKHHSMILDKKSVEKIFKHVNDKKAEEEKSLALFFDSD